MDDELRKDVLQALIERLGVAADEIKYETHSLVSLWKHAPLQICEAIVECFALYACLPDHLAARELEGEGLFGINSMLNRLVEESTLTSSVGKEIAKQLKGVGAELRSKSPPTPARLRELCLKIVVANRLAASDKSSRTPKLLKIVLTDVDNKNAFINFLAATNQLAVELGPTIPADTKNELSFAVFLHCHLAVTQRSSILDVKSHPLSYASERDVEKIAQLTLELEFERLQAGRTENIYPIEYLQPLGFSAEDFRRTGRRYNHSYFSARLACAALMLRQCSQDELSVRWWILRIFLSEPKVRKNHPNINGFENMRVADFSKAVYQYYSKLHYGNYGDGRDRVPDTFENPLTSEYSSAWEWQKTFGNNGQTARAANELLKGTYGDADFVLKVLRELLSNSPKSPQSNQFNVVEATVPVALASKFGVYFRNEPGVYQSGEPSCKYGYKRTDESEADSATYQIKRIRTLCDSVCRTNPPAFSGKFVTKGKLAETVGYIYYEDGSNESKLREDFNWKSGPPTDWGERTSDKYVESENAPASAAHLWLYGRSFQKLVDQAIAFVGKNQDNKDNLYLGDGGRYTRFVLLVPKCGADKGTKVLGDYPGDRAMRRVLHYLGGTDSIEGIKLKTDLYEPIAFRTCLNENNQMFRRHPHE